MALPVLMDKAIVRHVIREPSDRGIANNILTDGQALSEIMPINSIVVEIIGTTSIIDNDIVKKQIVPCLPLLSSHMLMPIKKGEAVWLISFEQKNEDTFNYYWISRVHGDTNTEDANFTAPLRLKTEAGVSQNSAYVKSELIDQDYVIADYPKFNNFITMPDESQRFIISSNSNLESEIENLVKNSDVFVEPVPRYFKKENELALQGSNNTLIALKTFEGYNSNREWINEDFVTANTEYGSILKNQKNNDGFIDIVTGRSRFNKIPESNSYFNINQREFYTQLFTTSSFRTCFPTIVNALGKFENNKDFKNYLERETKPSTQEGKPDFNHDAARICLSEGRNLDSSFNVSSNLFNSFNVQLPQGRSISSITSKADNIRIIARQNYINNKDYFNKSMSSIVLLKEGIEPLNYLERGTQSFVVMDELGKIDIDGSRIQIGSNVRISNNHGEGNQVFIGQENENSQPMVLGNSLKDLLDNMCQQMLDFIEIFNNHGHASTSAIGSANNPGVVGQILSETSPVKDKITEIKNNLITIQSKMGKLQ